MTFTSGLPPQYLRAVETLASGLPWSRAAEEADLPADELKRYADENARVWQSALKTTRKRLLAEAGSEAMLMLRRLLRSDEEKLQLQAATVLMKFWMTSLRHRRGGKDAPADPYQLLHELMENLPPGPDDGDDLPGGRPRIEPPPLPPTPTGPVYDTTDGTTRTYDPSPDGVPPRQFRPRDEAQLRNLALLVHLRGDPLKDLSTRHLRRNPDYGIVS